MSTTATTDNGRKRKKEVQEDTPSEEEYESEEDEESRDLEEEWMDELFVDNDPAPSTSEAKIREVKAYKDSSAINYDAISSVVDTYINSTLHTRPPVSDMSGVESMLKHEQLNGGLKKTSKMDKYGSMAGRTNWDPTISADWDAMQPSDLCLGRVARDLREFYQTPVDDIIIHVDDQDISKMRVLMRGPDETPYDSGFFQFFLRCSPDYPISSPRVRFLTTGDGKVRFNPNLYANGYVCLSLIGTWTGPPWSAAQSISSLLISIRSLMNDYPYRNEPGCDNARADDPMVVSYNLNVNYQTLRVAVIDAVSKVLGEDAAVVPVASSPVASSALSPTFDLPESFRKFMLHGFLKYHDRYLTICETCEHQQNIISQTSKGTRVNLVDYFDPEGEGHSATTSKGQFDFTALASKIQALKPLVEAKLANKKNRDE